MQLLRNRCNWHRCMLQRISHGLIPKYMINTNISEVFFSKQLPCYKWVQSLHFYVSWYGENCWKIKKNVLPSRPFWHLWVSYEQCRKVCWIDPFPAREQCSYSGCTVLDTWQQKCWEVSFLAKSTNNGKNKQEVTIGQDCVF